MALHFNSPPSLPSRFPSKFQPISLLSSSKSPFLFFNSLNPTRRISPPILRLQASLQPESEPSPEPSTGVTDEWGEKSDEPEITTYSTFSDSDPPEEKDEWGGDADAAVGNSSASAVVEDELGDLKRCLVDSVYGTDLGFRAGAEVRAEVTELVNQLEASNPTPAPMESNELLDGNWVLVYTAYSELLPLLAASSIPLLKVKQITQSIDSSKLTIVNTITLSSPLGSVSFSASAAFEIRSPSRIQVQFKEGTFQPPEIKPAIDLPDSISLFGQTISLSPLQQSLGPLQEVVSSLSRAISGQPPLKVPIPGERSQSWLLTTYLDQDLRISRGDGGIFVLVKEGSSLLT